MNVRKGRRGAAALVLLAVGALTACSSGGPDDALDAFLDGWERGRLDEIQFVNPAGRVVASGDVEKQLTQISGDALGSPAKLQRSGDVKESGESASGTVEVQWTLPAKAVWRYDTSVRLRRHDDEWAVVWEPATVHRQLEAGDVLALERLEAPRAGVLDATGTPIVQPRPVVTVQLERDRVTDPGAAVQQLAAAFASIDTDVDLSDLPDRLAKAETGSSVELVVLRAEAYERIAARLRAVTGTTTVRSTLDLAPTRQFARSLLGTVSEATKEDLLENQGRYAKGDHVGHGGLQGVFDERLRGTPGESVVIHHESVDEDVELFRTRPNPGRSIRTTLDQRVQRAADSALSTVTQRSALVAVRASDGAVLAAANGPDGGTFNLAFEAEVPPGSTFKMVSAFGLLDRNAVKADEKVPCPSRRAAGGREFANFDDFQLGNVPFRTDFAKSCNTAFVALAPRLGPDGLATAGRSLGLGADYTVGLPAFSGKVSTGGNEAERAAAAFGQGENVVSPLSMASATAAVASGRWKQPTLVVDPAPASPVVTGPELKQSTLQPLRSMMRQVVTDGTATSLSDVPGEPVHGKTGTAEFGNDPDQAHAWFIGWQGDLAFAVFVEGGGHSSDVSVPAAERFLRALR